MPRQRHSTVRLIYVAAGLLYVALLGLAWGFTWAGH